MKSRYIRYTFLTVFLGLVLYLALGFGNRSFEVFCPFGGVESLWGLFQEGQFSCALGPLNLSILIAVLALTIVAKKAFCGWVCPIGFIGELLDKIGSRVFPKRPYISPRLNDRLKLLRYVVLFTALYFTYKTGELILRGYDPYYAIFSGFGHGTLGWITYITLGIIVIGWLLIPMFFCRYLCPLGATFDPFSRLGLIKVSRNEELCTKCGGCDEVCPYSIPISEVKKVRHRDCTNCLECIDACQEDDVLSLKITFYK